MSIECSECEWDARAGHDPDCSRSPEKKLDALRAENQALRESNGELNDLYTTYRGLVQDGAQVADVIAAVRRQLAESRAENERLTRDNKYLLDSWATEVEMQAAEIARLKEANKMLGEERDEWRRAFHVTHEARGEWLKQCPLCVWPS